MDVSQSPTQANDDRDYETACNQLTSSDNHGSNQSDELQTLQEGDTGAVNFGPLSQDGKHISQDSDILSPFSENPVLQRGDWRGQRASQRFGMTPARPSMAAPPETPVGPVNPFGARQKPASVLRATQLFNATQFSSGGAKKFASPTSSRPSPNNFHHTFPTDTPPGLLTSPIKNRLTSSPSIFRKSSPQVNIPTTSFAEPPSRTPPLPGSPRDEEAIPESPTCEPDLSPPRKRQKQEPLEEYEPVEVSQQRKLAGGDLNKVSDSDSDEDDDLRRRRRARQRREWAERKLQDISFEPPARTTAKNARTTRKLGMVRGARLFPGSTDEPHTSDDIGGRQPSPAAGRRLETPSNIRFTSVPPQEHSSIDNRLNMTSPIVPQDLSDGIRGTTPRPDRVPATSPPFPTQTDELAGLPRSSPPPKPLALQSSNLQSSVSLPAPLPPLSSGVSKRKYGLRRLAERSSIKALVPDSPMVIPESDIAQEQLASDTEGGDDTVLAPVAEVSHVSRGPSPVSDDLPPTQPPSTIHQQTRHVQEEEFEERPTLEPSEEDSRKATEEPPEEQRIVRTFAEAANNVPKQAQSPLSELSSTPSVAQSPMGTASTTSKQDLYDLPASSAAEPPVPKSVRAPLLRRTYGKVRRTLRMTRNAIASSRQHGLLDPDSTDELSKSPSRGTFNSSMMVSRTSGARSARLSDSTSTSRNLLFDNMAFAISFQARRDDETADEYKERCNMSEELCDLVTKAGGRILASGFNELLDPATLRHTTIQAGGQAASEDEPDSALELGPEARGLGFTALLADGHSRKVKYMQALALGLPCLAYQWATACLEKGEILDWSPYLLCAGQSVCVGNAILSRHLSPYPAIGASLEDVFAQRKELLGGNRILLVMKKSRTEENRMAYLLLARILGAKLTRMYNISDARAALRHHEARNQKFDWVYVDEETGSLEQLFSTKALGQKAPSRKRKRPKAKETIGDEPAPGRVRYLSNELVIQSLIMGRIIDEDERALSAL
ncbi:hypothetical protein jhhlp_004442 [Lomentospora prolificans]|uniref:BRCT domain-containing protein n=1 Tax=Lomentospora prolificans TaxID=41688 RepID=A0A2N3NBK6_9PEZI|nr:hypothetical protein jhhlp_004442 [Lomentospora prolificans]